MSAPATTTAPPWRQPWPLVLAVFAAATMVETAGVGQLLAFVPLYLTHLGLPSDQVPAWTGLLFSLNFLAGLPLVPFWGIWADRYGRRLIIARSAFVEVAVFGLAALAHQPWHLAVAVLLIGLQLGNTGIMLAALRSVTPARRVGLATSLLGAMAPVGLAVGPTLGGWLIDGAGWSVAGLLALESGLSLAMGLLILFALREPRPARPATADSAGRAAWSVLRTVAAVPITRWLFLTFLLYLFGRQMVGPYLPLMVQHLHPGGAGLATAIGTVVGTAGLVGALLSPVAGALGDRLGYRRVMAGATVGAALAVAAMPFAGSTALLAALNGALSACGAPLMAMFYTQLATVVPEEQRAATLNLALVPLYLAGILGPALAAALSFFSLEGVVLTAAAFIAAALYGQRRTGHANT